MTKQEYMDILKDKLKMFDKNLVDEIIEDYEGHFRDGLKKGKSEEAICTELGDVDEMIGELQQLYDTSPPPAGKDVIVLETAKDPFSEPGMPKPPKAPEVPFMQDYFDKDHGKEEKKTAEKEENYHSRKVPCKRVILDADCAEVSAVCSSTNEFRLSYQNNGSTRQQMLYHFTGEQKGDTFYGRINRESGISTFFRYLSPPSMEIRLEIPKEFELIEIRGISGDVEMRGIHADAFKIKVVSGDISLNDITCKNIEAYTSSGEIELSHVEAMFIDADSKSGDISMGGGLFNKCKLHCLSGDISGKDVKGIYIHANSYSGDVDFSHATADEMVLTTKSGEAELEDAIVKRAELSSISGDVKAVKVTAEEVSAKSVSGSVTMHTRSNQGMGKTTSGEITVINEGNLTGQFHSVSGNISVTMENGGEGYQADVTTTSGSIHLYLDGKKYFRDVRNGRHTVGGGKGFVTAKSMSGNITMKG